MANSKAQIKTGFFKVDEEFLREVGALDAWRTTDLSAHVLPDEILRNGFMEIIDTSGTVSIRLLDAKMNPHETAKGKDKVKLTGTRQTVADVQDSLKLERTTIHKKGYYEIDFPDTGQLVYLDGRGNAEFYDAGIKKWGKSPAFIYSSIDVAENMLYAALNDKGLSQVKKDKGIPDASSDGLKEKAAAFVAPAFDAAKATLDGYKLHDIQGMKPHTLYVRVRENETADQAMKHPDAVFYKLEKGVVLGGRKGDEVWKTISADDLKEVAARGEFAAVKPEEAKAKGGFELSLESKNSFAVGKDKFLSKVAAQTAHNPEFVLGATVVGIGAICQMVDMIKSRVQQTGEAVQQKAKGVWDTIGKVLTFGGLAIVLTDVVARGVAAAQGKEYEGIAQKFVRDPVNKLVDHLQDKGMVNVPPGILKPAAERAI